MSENVIEIRPDKKNPADMNKCKLFINGTEIVNVQPMKLFNDHGRLILRAEIHFVKRWLKEKPAKSPEKKKKEDNE